VTINKPVPFYFSPGRVGIILALVGLYYLLREKSKFYQIRLNLKKRQQKIVVGGLIGASFYLIWQVGFLFNSSNWTLGESVALGNDTQYQVLAESLAVGRFDLGEAPSELATLKNPYDPFYREEAKVGFSTDTAYYQGKYYTYFGATPVLLFYLPFYLLTGNHLTNTIVVIIFGAMFVVGVYYWWYYLLKEKFKQAGLLVYLVVANLIIFSSGFLGVIKWENIYQPPVMGAVALTMLGLGFYQHYRAGGKGASGKILLGSICLALVAGCRPQLLLVGLAGVIYYFGRELWQRKLGVRLAAALVVPYLILGSMFAYYNYARFGSPLEFGANYNLTRTDYTHYGFDLARSGPAIFSYFLQLPMITPVFPFLSFEMITNYLGDLYREPTFGGLFWCYPWLWVLWLGKGMRASLKKYGLWRAVVGLIGLAIFICLLDVQMMGVTFRYGVDFSFLLLCHLFGKPLFRVRHYCSPTNFDQLHVLLLPLCTPPT
jgi:hypothetical protein